MLQEDGFSKYYSIVESFLDVEHYLLGVLREYQFVHLEVYVLVSKGKEEVLFFQLLEFLLVGGGAFDIESAVVDCAVYLLRHEFAENRSDGSLRQTNIRRAQGEHSGKVFSDLSFGVFFPVIHTDIFDFGQLSEALVLFHFEPVDAAIPVFSILGSHIPNSNGIILANIQSNCFLSCFHITKYLVEERVLGGLIKSQRNSSVTECVETVADLSSVDEIGACEQQMVSLSIDKQSQHNELEEVVESAGVLGDERDVFGLFEFASDDC